MPRLNLLSILALTGGGGAVPASSVTLTGTHQALRNPSTVQELADLLDETYRGTVQPGGAPSALFVNTDTGDDSADGLTPGTALLTLKRALQLTSEWPDGTVTINLDGTVASDLPATIEAASRITLQCAFTDEATQTVTGVVGASRAAGAIVQGITAAVGDVIEWLTGPLAGKFGRVSTVAGADTTITQNGTGAWVAPTGGDTLRIRTLTHEIRSAGVNNPAILGCHQFRINDAIFTDATDETILGLATDAIILERCTMQARTLVVGRGGSVNLVTCYIENSGNAFALRGMVNVPTGGVLQLTGGTIITDARAGSTAVAHVSILSEGVVNVAGENVFQGLGDEGILSNGGELVALAGTFGAQPTTRFLACDNGPRWNPGASGEGVSGSGYLGDCFGTVASDYFVTAQRGAYLDIGSAASVATATVPNAVSADDGATASANNADQTRISGGVPSASTSDPADVELWFLGTDYQADNGQYRARNISASAAQNWTFRVPSDFGSLVELVLVGQVSPTADGPAKSIDLISEYGAIGENMATHSETDLGIYDLTGLADLNSDVLDLSVVFSALAAGDYCGVEVDHNGIGGPIFYLGVRMRYLRA